MPRVIVQAARHMDFPGRDGQQVKRTIALVLDPAQEAQAGVWGDMPATIFLSMEMYEKCKACPCVADVVFGVRPGRGKSPEITLESMDNIVPVDLMALLQASKK